MESGTSVSRISIQVSLSGFSFTVSDGAGVRRSPWLSAEKIFTTTEFQKRYDSVEVSLLTPKFTLVPGSFFNEASARETLAAVAPLRDGDEVSHIGIPSIGAELIYSNSLDESLSRVIPQIVLCKDGSVAPVLPEVYYLLRSLDACPEYNKIMASWKDGWLHLVIAEGRSLSLCNAFKAADFTTAEYFIFLCLKQLQLNPEMSSIFFRTDISPKEEMSLYNYFKAVGRI